MHKNKNYFYSFLHRVKSRTTNTPCYENHKFQFVFFFFKFRPTSRSSGGNQNSNGVSLPAGLADDQSKDFDFEKTEMKYDSTGMFHWSPARNLEDCILVRIVKLFTFS